uniref:Uncharacterized protein n=1 Tax=Oryza nivara TaxID=4536 RepID=A0A0E0J671_ORYNI
MEQAIRVVCDNDMVGATRPLPLRLRHQTLMQAGTFIEASNQICGAEDKLAEKKGPSIASHRQTQNLTCT